MGKTAKTIIAAIILIALVALVWLVAGRKHTSAPTSQSPVTAPSSPDTKSPPQGSPPQVAATITYTGSGFEPQSTTVKAGDTVLITNQSHALLDFDSDPHPQHTNEPELNVGEVSPGTGKAFTVTKPGTWGFHNHDNPSQKGSITVQ